MLVEVQRSREAWGRACSSVPTRRVYGPSWYIYTVLIFEASSQQSLSLHQWPVSPSIENLKIPWKHLFVAGFGLSPLLYFSFELSPSFPQRNSQIFYFKIMGLNQMIHLGSLPLGLKNKKQQNIRSKCLAVGFKQHFYLFLLAACSSSTQGRWLQTHPSCTSALALDPDFAPAVLAWVP